MRQSVEAAIETGKQRFAVVLEQLLNHPRHIVVFLCSLLLICSSALYYERIRFVASAELDQQQLRLDIDFVKDSSFSQASAALLDIQQQIRFFDQQQGLNMIQEIVFVLDHPEQPKSAQLFMYFADNIQRQISNKQLIEQLNYRLTRPEVIENIRNRSRSFGPASNEGFNLLVQANDLETVQNAATQLQQALADYPELGNIEDSLPNISGQYQLSLTRFAQQQDINMNQISPQLGTYCKASIWGSHKLIRKIYKSYYNCLIIFVKARAIPITKYKKT